MLDDWLARLTRLPPEKRAKQQLRQVQQSAHASLKAGQKTRDPQLLGEIQHKHKVRVAEILQRDSKPAPRICPKRQKPVPELPGDFWTNDIRLKLLWAGGIAGLFLVLVPFIS